MACKAVKVWAAELKDVVARQDEIARCIHSTIYEVVVVYSRAISGLCICDRSATLLRP